MGFTRTTFGPDLREIAGNLRNKEKIMLEKVEYAGKQAVSKHTPHSSGLMSRWLRHTNLRAHFVNIGPYGTTRHDQPAPAGTIKAFKEYYLRTYGKKIGGRPGKNAWWGLTMEQKRILRSLRLQGNSQVGGKYPPPLYFGAVSSGKVPGASNENANFERDIQDEIRDRIPAITARVMRIRP